MLYGAPVTRRRDALRNRAAILEAANDVLAGGGAAALMPEVARRAGVAQATLYRHFADRQALVAAVIDHQLRLLEALAAGQVPFRDLLHEVLRRQIAMHELVRLVRRLEPAVQQRYRQRAIAAVAVAMNRAHRDGHVRADLTSEDLALMFAMVQGAAENATGPAAARAVDLLMDGLFSDLAAHCRSAPASGDS
ncbi:MULTISPECIES: TetR/AcrR family transcriptional regulator [Actinoplanes]|uniref:TetR/AcrR family transcriptional regulator n=1 Tax=Actinoplanes TaxID=1865 RepID=UPI0005F2D01B|nr:MULTISPECIES: TetR/AcrR family transcriptional regulator [Actinoplanes]GLY07387.1 TetR family transcriptional regulator [Actinoplanes sp. NBRC 101535]